MLLPASVEPHSLPGPPRVATRPEKPGICQSMNISELYYLPCQVAVVAYIYTNKVGSQVLSLAAYVGVPFSESN